MGNPKWGTPNTLHIKMVVLMKVISDTKAHIILNLPIDILDLLDILILTEYRTIHILLILIKINTFLYAIFSLFSPDIFSNFFSKLILVLKYL